MQGQRGPHGLARVVAGGEASGGSLRCLIGEARRRCGEEPEEGDILLGQAVAGDQDGRDAVAVAASSS
jgi:hypothetical protein